MIEQFSLALSVADLRSAPWRYKHFKPASLREEQEFVELLKELHRVVDDRLVGFGVDLLRLDEELDDE